MDIYWILPTKKKLNFLPATRSFRPGLQKSILHPMIISFLTITTSFFIRLNTSLNFHKLPTNPHLTHTKTKERKRSIRHTCLVIKKTEKFQIYNQLKHLQDFYIIIPLPSKKVIKTSSDNALITIIYVFQQQLSGRSGLVGLKSHGRGTKIKILVNHIISPDILLILNSIKSKHM